MMYGGQHGQTVSLQFPLNSRLRFLNSHRSSKVTSINEPIHYNGATGTGTGFIASTLQEGKMTGTRLKSVVTKNKLSKNSQRAPEEKNLVTPVKKAPSTIPKSLTRTSIGKDVEIEMLDDHDSIKAIEKQGTQVQGTGSTQGETHSLTSGSSS